MEERAGAFEIAMMEAARIIAESGGVDFEIKDEWPAGGGKPEWEMSYIGIVRKADGRIAPRLNRPRTEALIARIAQVEGLGLDARDVERCADELEFGFREAYVRFLERDAGAP